METVIKVTPDNERYPNNLELYIKDEWGKESTIVIPKWRVHIVVEMLKKFISVNTVLADSKPPQECYKSGEPCKYGCRGLCKESC